MNSVGVHAAEPKRFSGFRGAGRGALEGEHSLMVNGDGQC